MAKKTFVDGAGLQRFKQNLDSRAVKAHQHSAADVTSGTLPVARGGTGLTASPSLLVNLAGTSAAAVFAASPRPGVTGTLPIANGGTGATSASAARSALGITPANIGAAAANHTHAAMGGATTSAAGTGGMVPAPAAGEATRYLRSDGTWAVPPDTNTTYTLASFGITATAAELNKLDGVTATAAELNYVDGVTSSIQTQLNGKAASSHSHSAATSSAAGFMAAADKAKLDALEPITTTEIDALFAE